VNTNVRKLLSGSMKRKIEVPFATAIVLASLGSTLAATLYVDQNSTNARPPYMNWSTAATNIQDAVNAAVAGDQILVTNGTYAGGVSINIPVTVRSVSGPQFTTIAGGGAGLGNGAILTGFTVTNAAGGASGGTLNNCNLTGNSSYAASFCTLNNCTVTGNPGGGPSFCTLNNCTVTGNSGYGASFCTLNNCTLTGNSGVGASYSTLTNCIVYFNAGGFNYDSPSTLNYCCTSPEPAGGLGNITSAPLFVDYVGSNLRLQSSSPCINAGNNVYAPAGPDLDGNPRIKGGTVDIGAYEFQNPSSIISYAWLQQYGLPTDGSADFTDPDGDSMNNWQEWVCGTDPFNVLSALRMLAPSPTGTNVTVTWQSVAGVNYFLQRSTNLSVSLPFALVATNVLGQAGTTSFTDTNATGTGPFFYRVGVGN
jgi:hypothetical protein